MTTSVDNFQPNLLSDIAPTDPVTFDVVSDIALDTNNGYVLVTALFDSTGDYEVVHDGVSGGFAPRYAHTSNRTPLPGPASGFSFKVQRSGGWPEMPKIRVIAFDGFTP